MSNYRHTFKEALKIIRSEYKDDFIEFLESGKASERFSAYLENDAQAQNAAEAALAYRNTVRSLERAVQDLPSAPKKGDKVSLSDALSKLF